MRWNISCIQFYLYKNFCEVGGYNFETKLYRWVISFFLTFFHLLWLFFFFSKLFLRDLLISFLLLFTEITNMSILYVEKKKKKLIWSLANVTRVAHIVIERLQKIEFLSLFLRIFFLSHSKIYYFLRTVFRYCFSSSSSSYYYYYYYHINHKIYFIWLIYFFLFYFMEKWKRKEKIEKVKRRIFFFQTDFEHFIILYFLLLMMKEYLFYIYKSQNSFTFSLSLSVCFHRRWYKQ